MSSLKWSERLLYDYLRSQAHEYIFVQFHQKLRVICLGHSSHEFLQNYPLNVLCFFERFLFPLCCVTPNFVYYLTLNNNNIVQTVRCQNDDICNEYNVGEFDVSLVFHSLFLAGKNMFAETNVAGRYNSHLTIHKIECSEINSMRRLGLISIILIRS